VIVGIWKCWSKPNED